MAVRVGVVGAGSLGSRHARIYSELARNGEVELAGLHDTDPEVARRVARPLGIPATGSMEELCSRTDAISLVTPTETHFDLASRLLDAGKHVLVEKPITRTPEEATRLTRKGREKGVVLQVGHVERFNPVFKSLRTIARDPRFIEVHRLSPFPRRSTDIGVVLDLMIHDLDIVLAFVDSPPVSVEGTGVSVLSAAEDIANARIRFANGCIANLTASRVSAERLRKIRVFSAGASPSYVSLDYRRQEGYICRMAREGERETSLLGRLAGLGGRKATVVGSFAGRRIVREPVPIRKEEPLRLELQSFIRCIKESRSPVVGGESATRALDLAMEIVDRIPSEPDLNCPRPTDG